MTDKLGGAGQGPRFHALGPVQGPQAIGLPGGLVLPPARPAGPRFASDQLAISEQTRNHYAALIDGGAAAADADPELMLHLQLVHGPNSPLFEGLRETAEGRERLAAPAGPPPWLPPGPETAERPAAGPLERLLTRAFADVAFAWRNFAETQRW